jgi:hypothetical protein
MTEADFNTMYDKLFAGTKNFGTGDKAEANKKALKTKLKHLKI